MYAFVSKMTQIKLKYVLDNTKLIVLPYVSWIHTFWNEYFVKTMILHSRNKLESSEGWIYTIRKENKPSEGSRMIQKDELSWRLCSEGWPPNKCFSWSISPSKLLLHDSRIRFKSQIWCDKIHKKCWQVWKVGELSNNYFPCFMLFFKGWERKQLLLYPVLD